MSGLKFVLMLLDWQYNDNGLTSFNVKINYYFIVCELDFDFKFLNFIFKLDEKIGAWVESFPIYKKKKKK